MLNKKKKSAPEVDTAEENTTVQFDAEAEEAAAQVEFEQTEATEADAAEVEEEEVDPLVQELEKQKDNYLRLAAEYENFRKRTVREKEALSADIKTDCITAILPIIDNLERAALADGDAASLKKGVELVMSQASQIFENLGVEGFGAVGDDFDPNLHHCVSTASTGEVESGQITLVMQKGYKLGGKLIRPAMVQTEE